MKRKEQTFLREKKERNKVRKIKSFHNKERKRKRENGRKIKIKSFYK